MTELDMTNTIFITQLLYIRIHKRGAIFGENVRFGIPTDNIIANEVGNNSSTLLQGYYLEPFGVTFR